MDFSQRSWLDNDIGIYVCYQLLTMKSILFEMMVFNVIFFSIQGKYMIKAVVS